jgi:hypothetical protein
MEAGGRVAFGNGIILEAEPLALSPLAAAVRLCAALGALALERGLPRELGSRRPRS